MLPNRVREVDRCKKNKTKEFRPGIISLLSSSRSFVSFFLSPVHLSVFLSGLHLISRPVFLSLQITPRCIVPHCGICYSFQGAINSWNSLCYIKSWCIFKLSEIIPSFLMLKRVFKLKGNEAVRAYLFKEDSGLAFRWFSKQSIILWGLE